MLSKIGLKNIFMMFVFLFCFFCGYYWSYAQCASKIKDYQIKAEKEKSQLLLDIAKIESETRDKISVIEHENLQKEEALKNEYEETIADMRTKYTIANSVQCESAGSSKRVSEKASNTNNLRCFKEHELYRKIERSLVIANECDKLANDYNALLKICKL
jgi:hypothetical protein